MRNEITTSFLSTTLWLSLAAHIGIGTAYSLLSDFDLNPKETPKNSLSLKLKVSTHSTAPHKTVIQKLKPRPIQELKKEKLSRNIKPATNTKVKTKTKTESLLKQVAKQPIAKETKRAQLKGDLVSPELTADYKQKLSTWLEKFKRYPERALKRRTEGQGVVRVTIRRDGYIASSKLLRSTGSKYLDQEIISMVKRASPFPHMPEFIPSISYTFELPVDFKIR